MMHSTLFTKGPDRFFLRHTVRRLYRYTTPPSLCLLNCFPHALPFQSHFRALFSRSLFVLTASLKDPPANNKQLCHKPGTQPDRQQPRGLLKAHCHQQINTVTKITTMTGGKMRTRKARDPNGRHPSSHPLRRKHPRLTATMRRKMKDRKSLEGDKSMLAGLSLLRYSRYSQQDRVNVGSGCQCLRPRVSMSRRACS